MMMRVFDSGLKANPDGLPRPLPPRDRPLYTVGANLVHIAQFKRSTVYNPE